MCFSSTEYKLTKLFTGIVKDQTNADIGWMNNKSPFYNEGYKAAARELTIDYAIDLLMKKIL